MSHTSNAANIPTQRRAMERLLSAEDVADFLGIPVATLYQWRHKGCGPDAYRVGRHLRYDPSTVRSWLEEHHAARHAIG